MESGDQYGPPLPPGLVSSSESNSSKQAAASSSSSRQKVLGPQLPPGLQRSVDSDDLSDEGQLTVKMESPTGTTQDSADSGQDDNVVGPMPSEMCQDGDLMVNTAEQFEMRSKRMKEKLTSKGDAEEGPQKREEWMTELPPEMSKNFGLQARTFSKSRAEDTTGQDRSIWTDTPASKKDKESKGKKRKREEVTSQREEQMQQQVEEYNKANRPESLLEMHNKKQKKKKNQAASAATSSQADSTQVLVSQGGVTAQGTVQTVNGQQVMVAQPGGAQDQQQMQQYYQLTEEMRDSLDLLADKSTNGEAGNNAAQQQQQQVQQQQQQVVNAANMGEYYGAEYSTGEFNEAKPLADLLMTPQVVNYGQQQQHQHQQAQEVVAASNGAGAVMVGAPQFSSSQMIAQAYSHAQQLSQGQGFQQVVVSSNNGAGFVTAAAPNNGQQRIVTSLHDAGNNGNGIVSSQAQMQAVDMNGQPLAQAQVVQQQVQAGSYADAYAAAVAQQQQDPNNAAALVQQPGGQVVTFSLANGQNMIIAGPHTQQAGQNYVIQSAGQPGQPGQSIVIAAPQQATGMPAGNFLLKDESGQDLGQNIVLTQQNLQQALAQGMVLTPDGQLATPDGLIQRQQAAAQQVSLVLPHVNQMFPQQVQTSSPAPSVQGISGGPISPQSYQQLAVKMDQLMGLVKNSQTLLMEMNRRVERIENHLFPQGSPQQIGKMQTKGGKIVGAGVMKPGGMASPSVVANSKTNLRAALPNYLQISEYTASDELKRSDSDLFIPVGTMSLTQQQGGGQQMLEAPSPSTEQQETASSTVEDHDMTRHSHTTSSSDINVPIIDSQSGMAVPVYDDGDGQKYELGPGSSKEPNARFSSTSANPKTKILDPRFWDILVEDFQKNMSSDQIISAMSGARKPLVRSIGQSEISICSTVLKEAETACQGRRERLAKELVFRIFTLGEVYDRNVSGVFYINGKKMENKNKALDPAKMAAIHYLVMKYPPSVVDNPRLERLVWKNCVDRINDALRRIYNWIHKIVDVDKIMFKLPTEGIMMH